MAVLSVIPTQVPALGVNTAAGSYKVTIKGGNANQMAIDNAGEQFTEFDYFNNGSVKATTYYDNSASEFVFRNTQASGGVAFDTNSTRRLLIRSDGLMQPASASFTANGTVATTITSLGPTGANTTIQEWLTIKNAGGTTRYIPCY